MSIFEEVQKLYDKKNSDLDFLKSFYETSKIWDNKKYMQSRLIYGKFLNEEEAIPIFVKRTKNYIKKYVDSGYCTKEELKNSLSIIVFNDDLISTTNIEKTIKDIRDGVYYSLIKKINNEIEEEEILDLSDDFMSNDEWEALFNE